MSRPYSLSRRHVLTAGLVGAFGATLGDRQGWAASSCSYKLGSVHANQLVSRISETPADTYFTYPHSNGFLANGMAIIASNKGRSGIEYATMRFGTNAAPPTPITTIDGARLYYAVSQNGFMAVSTLFGVKLIDLRNNGKIILDWTDPEYSKNQQKYASTMRYSKDIDISKNGTKILTTRFILEKQQLVSSVVSVLEVETGRVTNIYESVPDPQTGKMPGYDHAHFSPFDENWICFSDASYRTRSRMWVWHPKFANPARPILDQSNTERMLIVTHERALFHKPAILTIADGSSPGSPRGLYEVSFSDGRSRLVSESNRDQHCNASHDGQWYVATDMGGDNLERNPGNIDLCPRVGLASGDGEWLKNPSGYSFSDVVVVNPKTGNRAFLYRAANANDGQPYEVQPSISPDGRWVIVKDARQRNVLGLEINQNALREFLAG